MDSTTESITYVQRKFEVKELVQKGVRMVCWMRGALQEKLSLKVEAGIHELEERSWGRSLFEASES